MIPCIIQAILSPFTVQTLRTLCRCLERFEHYILLKLG